MVKLTREESFFLNSVIVVLASRSFDVVSIAFPFTLPVFWAVMAVEERRRKKIKHVRLIAVDYSYKTISAKK